MDDWGWLLVALGVGVVVGLGVSAYLKTSALNQPLNSCSGSCPLNRDKTVFQNEDVYEWTDWKGRDRRIVRHRKIKLA